MRKGAADGEIPGYAGCCEAQVRQAREPLQDADVTSDPF